MLPFLSAVLAQEQIRSLLSFENASAASVQVGDVLIRRQADSIAFSGEPTLPIPIPSGYVRLCAVQQAQPADGSGNVSRLQICAKVAVAEDVSATIPNELRLLILRVPFSAGLMYQLRGLGTYSRLVNYRYIGAIQAAARPTEQSVMPGQLNGLAPIVNFADAVGGLNQNVAIWTQRIVADSLTLTTGAYTTQQAWLLLYRENV